MTYVNAKKNPELGKSAYKVNMNEILERTDGVIYGVYTSSDRRVVSVQSCFGDALADHQKDIAAAIRRTSPPGNRDQKLVNWLIERIEKGQEVRMKVLQNEVAKSDLEFFTEYWIGQFPSLLSYPENVKKPSIIGDAGLSISENL